VLALHSGCTGKSDLSRGGIGQGQPFEKVLGYWVYAAGGDLVAEKRCLREGGDELRRERREVARSLGRGRNEGHDSRRRDASARALVSAKEEQFVLPDGPSYGPAELVAFESVLFWGEEVARIERPVAQELECTAVQLVGAGFGDDVDHAA